MNYLKIYNNIIERARSQNRVKSPDQYYERHHVLPKSWGGCDEKFNIVLLSAKEHWISHVLLTKIATGGNVYKAYQAVVNMGRVISSGKRKTSKMYSIARQKIAIEVSKKHVNTLIVKDSLTGIRIGRVSKSHPKVLSGEWVFFHVGMTRSYEYKQKISNTVSGVKNGNFKGLKNEQLFDRCIEVFLKYGYWNYNITRLYCERKYGEKVPRSFGGSYRQIVSIEQIQKVLIDRYGATDRQLGSYAKHYTTRIKQEIENEFNN